MSDETSLTRITVTGASLHCYVRPSASDQASRYEAEES